MEFIRGIQGLNYHYFKKSIFLKKQKRTEKHKIIQDNLIFRLLFFEEIPNRNIG